MNEIYIPNIFRRENIRTLQNGEKIASIPYIMDFDLENDEHLSVMLHYQIATLMENILLFDRVYLDIMDLPIAIDLLYKTDSKSTKELLKKGYISFINCDEIIVSTTKDVDVMTIALMGREGIKVNNVAQLNKTVFDSFCYKNEIYHYLPEMLLNSKKYTGNVFEIGKKIVHLIDNEIRAKTYNKIGIGINGNYAVTEDNKGVFDAICQVVRDETVASILGINTIYHDDIVREIAGIRMEKFYSLNVDFNKLMYLNDIPDIHQLYFNGSLTIEDILKLKQKKEYRVFQKWFFDQQNENKDIMKNFYIATKQMSNIDRLPLKAVRFLATSGLGALDPLLGTLGSIVDSFGIDLLKGITPNMFFVSMSKNFEKKGTDNHSALKEICVPYTCIN